MVSLKKLLYSLFFLFNWTDLTISLIMCYLMIGFRETNPLFPFLKETFWILNLIVPVGFFLLVKQFEKTVPKAYLVLSMPTIFRFLCSINNFYLITSTF